MVSAQADYDQYHQQHAAQYQAYVTDDAKGAERARTWRWPRGSPRPSAIPSSWRPWGSASTPSPEAITALAVNGQTFVLPGVGFVPAAQGAVQVRGVDADQHIAEDRLAGDDVAALFATAAEALERFLSETFGPIGDRLVAAHAAQDGSGGDAQHRGQAMAPSLGAAGIGNLAEQRGRDCICAAVSMI